LTDQGTMTLNTATSTNAPGASGSMQTSPAIGYTLTGTTGADTITTGAGADTITGGAGADNIAGGTGADVFIYTATTSALMATEAGSAAGSTDWAAAVGDDFTDFVSGTDKFQFAAAALTNAIGTETDTLVTLAAAGVVPATARFVELTAAFDGTTVDAITDINALTSIAVAIGDSFVVFMNDGTDGYLFMVEQVSAADTVIGQDIQLIGKVTGVTNVADGDFITA